MPSLLGWRPAPVTTVTQRASGVFDACRPSYDIRRHNVPCLGFARARRPADVGSRLRLPSGLCGRWCSAAGGYDTDRDSCMYALFRGKLLRELTDAGLCARRHRSPGCRHQGYWSISGAFYKDHAVKALVRRTSVMRRTAPCPNFGVAGGALAGSAAGRKQAYEHFTTRTKENAHGLSLTSCLSVG